MARKKEYSEDEVLEEAMQLFWKYGYDSTSMKMLEEAMGINKFSIYSSFGSKHGLFVQSLKRYKANTNMLFDTFKKATNGVEDIKQFFYDSVSANLKGDSQKGCFVTNTYNEFSESEDQVIKEQMLVFFDNLKQIIIEKLSTDPSKDEATIIKQANYLMLAKHGLAAAARVNTTQEIKDYIEITFKNL